MEKLEEDGVERDDILKIIRTYGTAGQRGYFYEDYGKFYGLDKSFLD